MTITRTTPTDTMIHTGTPWHTHLQTWESCTIQRGWPFTLWPPFTHTKGKFSNARCRVFSLRSLAPAGKDSSWRMDTHTAIYSQTNTPSSCTAESSNGINDQSKLPRSLRLWTERETVFYFLTVRRFCNHPTFNAMIYSLAATWRTVALMLPLISPTWSK